MDLIKQNIEKKRAVYLKDSDTIRKFWYDKDSVWIQQHAEILNKVQPGYVKFVGENYIDFTRYLGQPASNLKHTPKFRDEVCKFCVNQINSTLPYAHGDWVLSNIIVDGDVMRMVDWDNVGIYDKVQVLHQTLLEIKLYLLH